MKRYAKGKECRLGVEWESYEALRVKELIYSLGYLPLDDQIVNECFIDLLDQEIKKLETRHSGWRIFFRYVVDNYVSYGGRFSPKGMFEIKSLYNSNKLLDVEIKNNKR